MSHHRPRHVNARIQVSREATGMVSSGNNSNYFHFENTLLYNILVYKYFGQRMPSM